MRMPQRLWTNGLALFISLTVLGATWTARGATKTWDGGAAPDQFWSTDGAGGNWSGDLAPVDGVDDVLFNDGGADATFGNVTNVLDIPSLTLTGLTFANTSGNTHTTDLNGNTLTVLGDVNVNYDLIGQNTLAGFTDSVGTGGLSIGNGTQAITIGRRITFTGGNMSGRLDLSGLANVTMDAATITLSDNDTNQTSTTSGQLDFGMNNTVTAGTFYVGRRKGTATVDIVSGGTLNLGTSADRTDLRVSYADVNTSFNGSGNFDMSGGTLVAYLSNLIVGAKTTGTSGGNSIGTFTLSANSGNNVDVDNVTLGDWSATGSGTASGTITMSGGTFTVNNNLMRGNASGSGHSSSTVNVNGGTMSVGGDLMVDTVAVGINGHTGMLSAGGDVQIGSGSETINVGRRSSGGGHTTSGTLDLSSATSTDINAGILDIALNESSSDATDGTVKLSTAGDNTLTAGTVRIGYVGGPNTGATSGTLVLGGAANNLSVDTFYVGQDKATGHVSIAAGGVLTLGGKTGAATDLYIGDNGSSGTSTNPLTSTFDMIGADSTSTLTLGTLTIGAYAGTGTGSGKGVFSMDAGTVNADSVVLATSAGSNPLNTQGTINLNGGAFNVVNDITDGNGVSTLNVNGTATMTVGGNAAFDTVNIGTPGGNTGSLDTSGGSTFNLTATNVNIAVSTSSGSKGTLILAPTSSITADSIVVSDNTSSGQPTLQSKITLGATSTTIAANDVTIGGRKGNGVVAFNGSGVLNLGSSGDRIANLNIGDNNVGTGTDAIGLLDGTGGTINAYVDNMLLGRHLQSTGSLGTGSGTGTLTLTAGLFDINTITLADSVNSTATARGIINLNGGTLHAGLIQKGGTAGSSIATLNVNGSAALTVDTTATFDTVNIGVPGGNTGSLDTTGGPTFNLTTTNLNMGMTTSSSSAKGTLILAPTSSITATNIVVSDSNNTGQDSVLSQIVLGTDTTTIAATNFTIGGRKGDGLVAFNGSGVLKLGSSGDRIANLHLGYNNVGGTGTHAQGTLDSTGGTINAYVDNMVLGQHASGAGSGTGTLTLTDGVFNVNTLMLGDAPAATSTATGIVNLMGGTLRAGTIEHGSTVGSSTATFNFTGGRLAVDNFDFTLNQDGGVLAPGDSPGLTAITDDYNLNAGSIEIQVDGPVPVTDFDRVTVTGTATFAAGSAVDVLAGYTPSIDSHFDVVIADTITDNGVTVNLPDYHWSYAILSNVDGVHDVLRLNFVVPEPATIALLGPAMLLMLRRRRKA